MLPLLDYFGPFLIASVDVFEQLYSVNFWQYDQDALTYFGEVPL